MRLVKVKILRMDEKMKTKTDRQIGLRSEEGFISLDFAFALTMSFSFAIIFFVLALTLATVEAGQYITFATARAYHGAHESETLQQEAGRAKYSELVNKGVFKRLFNQGWVALSNPRLGDFNDQYPDNEPDAATFVGAQVTYRAKVLNLRFPVVGQTVVDDPQGVGTATLNAYLMREVSSAECREMNLQRYEKIRALESKYNQLPNNQAVLITDNGC